MVKRKIFMRETRKALEHLNISDESLGKFYDSIEDTFVHSYREEWDKILEIDKNCQWPVLRFLDNQALLIYEDADEGMRTMFINSIRDEKALLSHLTKNNRKDSLEYLRIIIRDRLKFFKIIFNITDSDIYYFQRAAKKSNWKKWAIGSVIAAGAIGGIAAYRKKGNK